MLTHSALPPSPGQRRILAILRSADEIAQGEIAARTGRLQSNVSRDLRVLRSRGLVSRRWAGRLAFYSLTDRGRRVAGDA